MRRKEHWLIWTLLNVFARYDVWTLSAAPPSKELKIKCQSKSPSVKYIMGDYTLWPFWIDTHVNPPFRVGKDGQVYDGNNHQVKFYPDVPQVLQELHSQGYSLAIASRTSCRAEANDLTRLFNWDCFFCYKEIYPGSKTTHFAKLQKQSGIDYEDMIFFDDEHRNIMEVGNMGVMCILVEDGVTKSLIKSALQKFADRKYTNNLK